AVRRIACIQREIKNALKKQKDEGFFIPKMVHFGTDVTPKVVRQNRERAKNPEKESKPDEAREQREQKLRADLAKHLKEAGFSGSD
ncbi:MAG: hypothetical protein IKX46_02525, partial [Verrucomicrobia bacterium]|nr:hypothetical protein [Verrucomicrobiota bacterium]